jgi:hypothetical protein
MISSNASPTIAIAVGIIAWVPGVMAVGYFGGHGIYFLPAFVFGCIFAGIGSSICARRSRNDSCEALVACPARPSRLWLPALALNYGYIATAVLMILFFVIALVMFFFTAPNPWGPGM